MNSQKAVFNMLLLMRMLVLLPPQVKRFSLHSKAVKHISFDDKAEYFASCCGDNYISVRVA